MERLQERTRIILAVESLPGVEELRDKK